MQDRKLLDLLIYSTSILTLLNHNMCIMMVIMCLLSAFNRGSDRYTGFNEHVKYHLIIFINPNNLNLHPLLTKMPEMVTLYFGKSLLEKIGMEMCRTGLSVQYLLKGKAWTEWFWFNSEQLESLLVSSRALKRGSRATSNPWTSSWAELFLSFSCLLIERHVRS